MAARGFLGAGDLYIRRMVAGAYGPWQGKYESSKFEIKPNVDTKEMVSKGRDTYGQVIESVVVPQPADLTVELAEVNKESLAIALMGTTAAVSQTGGTLTDEAIADAPRDVWLPLSKHNLTGNPTVKVGSTTYTQGTDYLVDKQMGWIKVLSTGTIPDSSDLLVSSAYGSSSGNEIRGMTDPQLRVQFRLEGKNFVDGAPFRVVVYEAIIASDNAFDFLQDNFASVSLKGRMKTPTGYNEPFIVQMDT
jgi:hypothetical protein